MSHTELQAEWNKQYETVEDTALRDQNLFELEVDALVQCIIDAAPKSGMFCLVELGCGTGALLSVIQERLLQAGVIDFEAIGVDFSNIAIEKAKGRQLTHVSFSCCSFQDFFNDNNNKYDVILSQRSIMALMEEENHLEVLTAIEASLTDNGVALLSECFAGSFDRFNVLRQSAGLDPIDKVWHSRHLSEKQVEGIFGQIDYVDFCSSYMLATRLIYPLFEEPIHNSKIHTIARNLPNGGDSSYLKIAVASKIGK